MIRLAPLSASSLDCPLLSLCSQGSLSPSPPRSQEPLYSAASLCAHRVTPGTLHWRSLSCLPPLLQGKQLERRLKSPVPSMRPDNRSCSMIVKLVEDVPLVLPQHPLAAPGHISPLPESVQSILQEAFSDELSTIQILSTPSIYPTLTIFHLLIFKYMC